ncbi:MAG: cysteine desulfurase [Clostridiales bacterium]|nr:cysteine desulfurase [Clostridiales bacterium]
MEVYLDNSATTRPSDAVVTAMSAAMTQHWHNPSALYKPAMQAEKLISAARKACLEAAGAVGHRLIFTSGGTEADNIAIFGHLRRMKKPGRVLILSVEHPAVLACEEEIRRMGHQVALVGVKRDGTLNLEEMEAQMDESVHLICVMQVNNESGAIQPLGEVVRLRNLKCPQAAIHVDGVQGFLRLPMDFNKLGIQSYAFSGHKIHACKGVGGLIVRKDHRLNPIVFGGGQEEGYRSGTENVPGIIGLGEAVRVYPRDGAARMMDLKRHMWESLQAAIPAAVLNGPALEDVACAPHILNVSLPPVRSQTMLFALEGDGVYVSAGSACASRKQKVSGVLTAMGLSTQMADAALRFSFCPENTVEEIDYAVACVKKHYDMLHKYVRR